jgi:hypothetical protein
MTLRIVNIIIKVGYVFYSMFAIYSTANLMLRNEFFGSFTFVKTHPVAIEIGELKNNKVDVSYTFEVNEKSYSNSQSAYWKRYKSVIQDESLEISYNEKYPSINYISGIRIVFKYYLGLFFSIALIIILFIVDKLSLKAKMASKYGKAFSGTSR